MLMTTANDHIGSAEAASIMGVDRSTLTRLAQQGVVPILVQLPGRTGARLFSRAEVERVAKERRRRTVDSRVAS